MLKFLPLKVQKLVLLNEQDYTDDRIWCNEKFGSKGFIISDDLDELKQFKNTQFNTSIKTITTKKPKVSISNSYFPSSLVSKLSSISGVKRCINPDKADIVVVDEAIIRPEKVTWIIDTSIHIVNVEEFQVGVIHKNYSIPADINLKIDFENATKHFGSGHVYYGYSVSDIQLAETIYNNQNKLMSTFDFIIYMRQFMPVPTLEELENIKNMLMSVDAEQSKLGWNMMQLYNFADHYKELYIMMVELIGSSNCWNPDLRMYIDYVAAPSAQSSSCKFVFKQLGLNYHSLKEIANNNDYSTYRTLLQYCNNPLLTPIDKGKAIAMFLQSVIVAFVSYNKRTVTNLNVQIDTILKDGSDILDNPNIVEKNLMAECFDYNFNKKILEALDSIGYQFKFTRKSDSK